MLSRILCAAYGCILGLKLAGVVDWSWWLVLAPIWAIPTLAIAAFCVVVIAVARSDLGGRR